MVCYVFKVRKSRYFSKRDNKEKKGYNVALLALEGAKFHLETFMDDKDRSELFPSSDGKDLSKVFAPGFWNIDIDEFEVYTPNGSQYQKKIISVVGKVSPEDAYRYL